MRPKTPWIVCTLCVLVTSSCEDPVGPREQCLLQAEFDRPLDITMFKGDSLQFSVVVRDCNNTVLPDYPVRWTSSDIRIVTVDSTGLVIALGGGRAWVAWSTDFGRASGSIPIQVNEHAARVEISPTRLIVVPDGPGFLTATAFAENGETLRQGWTAPWATWESGDNGIAVVDTAGLVRGVAEGITSITATVDDVSATVEVTVTLLTLADVQVGASFTCGVTTDALVFCWGGNVRGQLGDPLRPSGHRPQMVAGPTRVRSVTTGDVHACSLDEDGSAMCWGSGPYGQLGANVRGGPYRPSRVASDIPFRDVNAGSAHTCGITTGDMAFCWGHNASGQLGAESTSGCSFGKGPLVPCSLIPIAVSGVRALRVISAGGAHTCGLVQDHAVCWGANAAGQLGLGAVSDSVRSPSNVDTPLRFERISSGGSHTCAVTGTGEIYCWGNNLNGQLGDGSQGNRTLPVAVASTGRFTTVSAGHEHTCALTETGVAYCWGGNWDGQLGDGSGDQSPRLVPTLVAVVPALQSISAGARHSCGLGVDGVAHCWGDNRDGQLGAEAGDPSWLPIRVAGQR